MAVTASRQWLRPFGAGVAAHALCGVGIHTRTAQQIKIWVGLGSCTNPFNFLLLMSFSCSVEPYDLSADQAGAVRVSLPDGLQGEQARDLQGELWQAAHDRAPRWFIPDQGPFPEAHPPESQFVLRGIRHRPRSKYTRGLQELAQDRGWWTPDLPSSPAKVASTWLTKMYADTGIKVGLTNHKAMSGGVSGNTPAAVQVHFESDEGSRWVWVLPDLVAHLLNYRVFRPASSTLIGSLRSRARLWAEENGVGQMDLAWVMPGSVMLALVPTFDEVISLGSLRGTASQWSSEVLQALSKGQAIRSTRGGSWWDVFKRPIGGETKGTTLGGAGVSSVSLAA